MDATYSSVKKQQQQNKNITCLRTQLARNGDVNTMFLAEISTVAPCRLCAQDQCDRNKLVLVVLGEQSL